MDAPTLIAVVGPTCAGKSTLIDHLLHHNPTWRAVRVGQEMRKRYPPEHFLGRGAMESTEAEVWKIFEAAYYRALRDAAPVVLVDGQPRLPGHALVLGRYCPHWQMICLDADDAVLSRRADGRADSPGAAILARARLRRDRQDIAAALECRENLPPWYPTVITNDARWLDYAGPAIAACIRRAQQDRQS